MTVWLIHGWSETDGGQSTVGRLRKHIPNAELLSHDWPNSYLLSLIMQRKTTDMAAGELAAAVQPGDDVVCYSNGWQIALIAAEMGVKLGTVVAIAPAGQSDVEIPKNIKRLIVLHSEQDNVLTWAKVWSFFNPWNRWGRLGIAGYTGKCKRVENWPGRDRSHLDWFDDEPLEYWAPKISQAVK